MTIRRSSRELPKRGKRLLQIEEEKDSEPREETIPVSRRLSEKFKVETFFGGLLTGKEADTSKTTPDDYSKELFEQSLKEAKNLLPPVIDPKEEDGKVILPRILKIIINGFEIDTWYTAPYPEEYNVHEKLYICQYCLKYMKTSFMMSRHQQKCVNKHPPGDEIYRNDEVSIFEVDGRKNKVYCQNLCLLAKLFLDHKTLYYDVEPFLFYVITEWKQQDCFFVGYFSKEKRSSSGYNLSCIITLPCFQGKGYGQMLIDFSYLLSRKEECPGTPEKPLSDLGLISYRSYWRMAVASVLMSKKESVSIAELSKETGMTYDDIVVALQDLNLLKKSQETQEYFIVLIEDDNNDLSKLYEKITKGTKRVDPSKLRWIPFETKLLSFSD